VGAVVAAVALILIVVADRMYEGVDNDYLTTEMTYEEYLDRLGTIDAIWTVGTVMIAISVIAVALSVPATSTSSFEMMKKKLEADFYRKCPSCGSWNTKFAASCTTCGILLPRLQESSPVETGPRVMKGAP
jgi:hypothetical protein